MRGDTILIDISVSPDRCDFSKKHYTKFIPRQIENYSKFCRVFLSDVWSPITFKNNYRAKSNFMCAHLCVIDIDEGMGIDEACEFIDDNQYWGIIAPTKSHGKWKETSTGVKEPCDRFRLIMRFELPITDLKTYEQNMIPWIDRLGADAQCKDGARYFFPSSEIYYRTRGDFLKVVPYTAEDRMLDDYESHMWSKRTRYMYDENGKIPAHIDTFLKYGKPFGSGRQSCCFISALTLKDIYPMEKTMALIKSAPFDRANFHESEIVHAVRSAYKYK